MSKKSYSILRPKSAILLSVALPNANKDQIMKLKTKVKKCFEFDEEDSQLNLKDQRKNTAPSLLMNIYNRSQINQQSIKSLPPEKNLNQHSVKKLKQYFHLMNQQTLMINTTLINNQAPKKSYLKKKLAFKKQNRQIKY